MLENSMVVGNSDHDSEIPQEFLDSALAEIVDTVCAYGHWPARRLYDGTSHRRVEFDLQEFIQDNYDEGDIARWFARSLTDFSNETDLARMIASDDLHKKLVDYFTGGELVRELASRMMDEEKYE